MTRHFISPLLKSSIDFDLWVSLSLPCTSTLSFINSCNLWLSSFKSHHTSHCSSELLTSSAACSHLNCKLSFLACLRSVSVNVSVVGVSPSTIISCILIFGRLYPSISYPILFGLSTNTLNVANHCQNTSSACPFNLHFEVSPPSCTKNIDNISALVITPQNSE